MTFKEAWESKIDENNLPLYMRGVIEYEFKDFKNKVFNPTDEFVNSITNSLIKGDIFIIRNAINAESIEEMKKRVFNWSQSTDDSFHKILEGAPNFKRKVDDEISKEYQHNSIWNAHHFFRWNKDELDLFKEVDDCWSVLKVLSGYKKDSYMKNTPKDIIVDRLQFQHYPKGGGYLQLHSDPYEIMKTLACVKLSQKGVEYKDGGIYFINEKEEKINVEDHINIGDLYFSFPWVLHGIDQIDKEESDIKWNSIEGRWLMLLTMVSSNVIKDEEREDVIVY